MRKSIGKIEKLLEEEKVGEAERLWIQSRTVPSSLDLGFNPFLLKSVDEILQKEESRVKVSLGIPQLDKLIGPLKSGWLVIFMGPQKRGKTWILLNAAVHCCFLGYNVAFISLESEDEELAMRIWSNIGSLSTVDKEQLKFPYFSEKDIDSIRYKTRIRPKLTRRTVKDAIKEFKSIATGKMLVKVFPMGSASVEDIDSYLDSIDTYNNFQPDVIVIDYIGIIRAHSRERRDKYNEVSMGLKGLGQKREAVVFTGHQGRRETLLKATMSPDDMPEDIRILGNLDVLFGLNQLPDEREANVMRLSTLIHRHRPYTSKYQVKILQQLEAGQVVLDDRMIETPWTEEEALGKGEEEDSEED